MKVILKKYKNGECTSVKLYKSKKEAEKAKQAYLRQFTVPQKVSQKIQAHISKA